MNHQNLGSAILQNVAALLLPEMPVQRHRVRAAVCRGLEDFGLQLDPEKNLANTGREGFVSRDGSPAPILVIPANEELVIARQVYRFMEARAA